MRVHWTMGILVLGSLLPQPQRVLADEGKEFAPKNGMFTITVPAGQKTSQRTQVLTLNKHKVPVEMYQSVLKDGPTFLGASIGIPAVVMRDIPADKRFDIFRDLLVNQLKGKVLEEKDILQDPVPGKEYLLELPKGRARLQLYTVAGFVVYALVQAKTKEEVTSKETDAFFSSLKLTDKAKDVFREVKR